MSTILKKEIYTYREITIPEDQNIHQYLKSQAPLSYTISHLDEKEYKQCQNASGPIAINSEIIAAYAYTKENSIRLSNSSILGCFQIDTDTGIYLPTASLENHIKTNGCNQRQYITKQTMLELLKELLTTQKQFLIDLGESSPNHPIYEEVSKKEFLKYAQNKNKGIEVLNRRRY